MEFLKKMLNAVISKDQEELSEQEVNDGMKHLTYWEVNKTEDDNLEIQREYQLNSSDEAVEFVNRLNEVATERGHVPDVHILGNMVKVTSHSDDVQGLTQNDLIIAAHAEDLYARWEVITGRRDEVTQASDESFPASDPPAY